MAAGLDARLPFPPDDAVPAPLFHRVPAGSLLWRIGRPGSALFSTQMPQPDPRPSLWGGRFDPSPDDPFPFLYAGLDDLSAICETLLRDVKFDGDERLLPAHEISGRLMYLLQAVRPLSLVALTTASELAAARLDSWIVHAGWRDYPSSRAWGSWLRSAAAPGPDGTRPDGLVWASHRNPGGQVVMLYGDRCADAVVCEPVPPIDLSGITGRAWLERRMQELRTRIDPEASPSASPAAGPRAGPG